MKALVFSAGLGERMRPLTDTTPKPLLPVGGKPLIAWHLDKLAAIGVRDVVVNTSWLAGRFPDVLGDGHDRGLRLHYLYEGDTPLETGGGMYNALAGLGDPDDPNAAFIAVNGDIFSDYDFARLPRAPQGDAHLVLVDNPAHNPDGDFVLEVGGRIASSGKGRLTFSGIGVYRPSLFQDWRTIIGDTADAGREPPRFKLVPLLHAAMQRGVVSGEHHRGLWTDVGTPGRLQELEERLQAV